MTFFHYSQCNHCCYDINSVPSLKQPGETWKSGCQQCVCDKDTLGVQCEPITCPTQKPITCTEDGEVLVNRTVDCCHRLTCGEWFKVPHLQLLTFRFNTHFTYIYISVYSSWGGALLGLWKQLCYILFLFLYNSFLKSEEKILSVTSLSGTRS